MTASPLYSPSNVRTLVAAMNLPASAHAYALTDTASGTTRGVYATEQAAIEASLRLARPGMLFVLTVLHPDGCGCEVAA
jgi:hypothetical protein